MPRLSTARHPAFSFEVPMFDPKSLLDQFLGGQAGTAMRDAGQSMKGRLDQYSGSGGFMRGAAAGGLLGGRGRSSGGLLGYGGAAALGALALRAYQNYQQQQAAAPAQVTPDSLAGISHDSLPHAQPAADGTSFQPILIRAMIAAAKADGHIDADEQQRLFNEVERMGLGAEAKAAVFEFLSQPADLDAIGRAVASPEQAAELYLASRLAMVPDHPAERAYLDALAAKLKLPPALRAHLDASSA
jgi:uncharacterized membrane protein YebE (DUF533 family)